MMTFLELSKLVELYEWEQGLEQEIEKNPTSKRKRKGWHSWVELLRKYAPDDHIAKDISSHAKKLGRKYIPGKRAVRGYLRHLDLCDDKLDNDHLV